MTDGKNKVLIIVGPTAVGKTALGLQLAERFAGEIISGDSQQIYRGLDIGTAKATAAERARVPHHLIDVRAVTEAFSAHDFVTAASRAMADIASRDRLPIIVGGTGLYIQALTEGYHLGGGDRHDEMMALRAQLASATDEALYAELDRRQITLPEVNRRRAVRALELDRFAGHDLHNQAPTAEFLVIGLTMPRAALYDRIDARVDAMLSGGLLVEARQLYATAPDSQAAKAIGYKELFPYFAGDCQLPEAVATLKQHSRHYAKRQMTWFRNRMSVAFEDVTAPNFPENVIIRAEKFLSADGGTDFHKNTNDK